MKSVIILGNGNSRKEFNLNSLRSIYSIPIYGCNAIYRDFDVDKLFAIDEKITNEIVESSFSKEKFILTPWEEQFEPEEWNPIRPRENSGMVAMRYAIREGYDNLLLIGFDSLIKTDYRSIMSNSYIGTNGYETETMSSFADIKRRMEYFRWFIKKNSHVTFNFIFKDEKPFKISENFRVIDDETARKEFART